MIRLYKISFTNLVKQALLSCFGICMAFNLFAKQEINVESDLYSKKSDSFFHQIYSKIVTSIEAQLTDIIADDAQQIMSSALNMAPCPGGSGVIGGLAFGDFNYDGSDDQIGNMPNVTVNAYACDANGDQVLAGTATTDFNGEYFIPGLTDGIQYRLEFNLPAYLDYDSGMLGIDNATDVQFVTAPTCGANVGFSHPDDYAIEDPIVFAACFINGDPLAMDPSVPANQQPGNMDVLVAFPWSAQGDNGNANIYQANANEMGAIFGMTNNRYTNEIYTSAFIKRHAGMGSLGLGGIYKTSYTGAAYPGSTAFLDVASIGINVGSLSDNPTRGLPTNVSSPSNDPEAYDKVAAEGIGEITLDEWNNVLYFVNLFDQTVYSIDLDSDDNTATIPTATDVTAYAFENPNCTNGVFRPFAIEYYRDEIYAGGVCDASLGGTTSDITGKIFKLNTTSGMFEEIFSFPMDYIKGHASDAGSCESYDQWLPWNNTIPAYCNGGPTTGIVVNPQPVLSDIEFDTDGTIIIGVMDRFGHQIGNANYGKTGTNTYSAITGGDILRIYNNQGTYELESNGSAGFYTTIGANNGEGPNGGEFYFMDYFLSPFGTEPHQETSQGGIAVFPGSGQVATSAFDPISTNFFRGGFNWFSNETGAARDPGYVVFSSTTTLGGTFGKAAGIGGSGIMRAASAPLEIGGYLWTDSNEDGVQDGCEPALSGINVSLYSADGTLQASTQTTSSGQYYFNEDLDDLDLQVNTTYYVVVGTNGQFDATTGALNSNLFLTDANIGFGANSDKNDSDGSITTVGIANDAFTGLPSFQITTGNFGFVDHNTDFGFVIQVVGGIGGSIFQDNNDNGIFDSGDGTIAGVTIQLIDNSSTVIQTVTSLVNGDYFFPNVDAGDYTIVIDESTNTAGITVYELTAANEGSDDTIDSDATGNPASITVVGFDPVNGDALNYDAGFSIPGANISGSLFADANMNGINDDVAATYAGVTVSLTDDNGVVVGTMVVAADGAYIFTNIEAGDYTITFDLSTNTADYTSLTFSDANQGNDDSVDSDVNSTGSFSFSFDPANGNLDNIDAGAFLPTSSITGLVFNDLDVDGINESDEEGVSGVVVNLLDDTGMVIATVTTSPTGEYTFPDLTEGDYSIQIVLDDLPNDFDYTLPNQGNDDSIDSDVNNNGIFPFTFDPLSDPLVIDAGIFEVSGSIGDYVWGDTNQNGLQDNNESGVENVTVTLYDANTDAILGSMTTSASGQYAFENVVAGNYYINFDVSTTGIVDAYYTTPGAGNGSNDSDAAILDGTTADFAFDPANGNLSDIDAGVIVPFAMIGNAVWLDCNQNGLYDNGEAGYANVVIFLNGADQNGATVEQNTISGLDGSYSFAQVPPGNYQLIFALPASPVGLAWTTQNAGGDDAIDSDVNIVGNTGFFDLAPGQMLNTMDAGIIDNQAPIFTDAPADINTNCNDPILDDSDADETTVTVTDNLATNVVVTFNEEVLSGGNCEGGIVITRTWTASDNCGNTASHVQVITAADQYAPVIPSVPADVTLECGTFPSDTIKAVDDCDMDLEVMIMDTTFGSCPTIMERTYLVSDDCGNTVSHTQVVTWEDTTAPTVEFTNPLLVGMSNGDTVTIECDQEFVFGPDDATGMDICDQDLDMTFEDYITIEGNCAVDGFIRLMYCGWIATDDCGNEGSIAIYIKVTDTNTPVIDISLPGDITVMCENVPPIPSMPTASDNCTENLTVEYVELMTGDTCADYKILRAWITEDDCGNQTIEQYNIFVETPELMFTNPPADITIACTDGIPSSEDLEFTPACNNPELEFTEIIIGEICSDYKVNRVWTLTNDCGQTIEHLQVISITVEDLAISGVPADEMVDCEVPAPANVAVSSDCYAVTMDFNEAILGDTCSDYQIIRTWTATDECGNTVTNAQTIDVVVEELALVGVPDDITIECSTQLPAPANITTVGDCYEVTIDFNEQLIGDICSDYSIVRTWLATDACGNTLTESQSIYIGVPLLALMNVPADLTLECDELVPTPVAPQSTSQCYDTDIEFLQEMEQGDCPQALIITRTWVITDECDNQVSESHVITVEDNTAPSISFVNPMLNGLASGDSITIGCDEIMDLGPDDVIYDDNCDNNFTTDFMEMTDIGDCDEDGYIVRMECCWKAADACGNMSEFCVIIRITDDEAPVLSETPGDITVDVPNGDIIPTPPLISATDDCDGNPTIEFMETEQANPNGCGSMILRSWVAEDHCGNQTIHTQTIQVLEICDCPDIIVSETIITNASCMSSNGSIEVTMEFNPNIYDFVLIPNLGTASADGNAFTGLPVGSYLLVIDLPTVDDCEEKIFFDIVDDGCDDTIDITLDGTATELCMADYGVIQSAGIATSISFCNSGSTTDVLATTNNTDCITLTPAIGYEGTIATPICVEQCFDGSSINCETTYINVTVEIPVIPCMMAISDANVQDESCSTSNGSIGLTISGATGNITYDWNNGMNTATITGLTAGVYTVIATDEADCQVSGTYIVTNQSSTAITFADIAFSNVSCAGSADGFINSNTTTIFEVYAESGALLGSTPMTGLQPGAYTVKNAAATCPSEIMVTITQPLVDDISVASTPVTCAGADGTITLTVNGTNGASYGFNWSVGSSTTNTLTGLSFGNDYAVTVTNPDGCVTELQGLSVTEGCNCTLAIADVMVSQENCDQSDGSIEVSVIGNMGNLSYQWSPDVSTTNSATGLAAGAYGVTVTDETTLCITAATINVTEETFNYTLTLSGETCPDANDGIASITPANLQYAWSHDANETAASLSNLDQGIYTVQITDPATGCTATEQFEIEGPADWSFSTTINNETCATNDGSINIGVDGSHGGYTFIWEDNAGLGATATNLAAGTYQVTVVDGEGCSLVLDNLTVANDCDPCNDFLAVETAMVGLGDCDGFAEFCLDIPFVEASGYTFTDNGQPFTGLIQPCNFVPSLSYSTFSLPNQGQTGPYVVTSWIVNGQLFNGLFDDIPALVANLNVWDTSGDWALDANGVNIVGGNPSSSYSSLEITQTTDGAVATVMLDTNQIPMGAQFSITAGTHELVLTQNGTGCTDTVTVEAMCISSNTFETTITVGESGEYCLDMSELPGIPQEPELNCTSCFNANISIDGNFCAQFTGLAQGTAEAFIVYCDDNNLCDTTFLIINVVPGVTNPPIARLDVDSMEMNTSKDIYVMANDEVNGILAGMGFAAEASDGFVSINSDLSISYTPDTDYCGYDVFSYYICNELDCDTTTVNIKVHCEAPLVVNGFSPNNDGINDALTILNLEQFPNNTLSVFNRWGEQVQYMTNYQNDWKGTYRSADLPDGTYFYLLNYGDGETLTGYIQIQR